MDLHYMFPEINHENSWQKKKKKKLKQSEEKVKFVAKIKKKKYPSRFCCQIFRVQERSQIQLPIENLITFNIKNSKHTFLCNLIQLIKKKKEERMRKKADFSFSETE